MDQPRQHPTMPPLTDEELSKVEEDVECGSSIPRSIAFRLLPEVRQLRKALAESEKRYQEAMQMNKNAERIISALERELAFLRVLA